MSSKQEPVCARFTVDVKPTLKAEYLHITAPRVASIFSVENFSAMQNVIARSNQAGLENENKTAMAKLWEIDAVQSNRAALEIVDIVMQCGNDGRTLNH